MMLTGPPRRCWRGAERVCWSRMPFSFVLLSFAYTLGLERCWGSGSRCWGQLRGVKPAMSSSRKFGINPMDI